MTAALCENLRILLFQKNIKAADLSKFTKVPQATIHRMLSGESKNPHKSSLMPIANFFSVTVDQLLAGRAAALSKLSSDSDENQVPVFSLDSLGQEMKEAYMKTEFTCSEESQQSSIFATVTEDDSMVPLFPPGTTIILDSDKAIENGCYAVIKTKSNQVVFRQVIGSGGDFYLKPLSSDMAKHGIMRFEKQDEVCGVLVQAKLNF
jgi:SOS-response transcriptional repressor LexA